VKELSPEINFAFLLGGEIKILDGKTGQNITAQFDNVNMMVNKAYCDGTINGPFEQLYVIASDGKLVRQSIGTWSFRMDNTKDYMNVNFFCKGADLGTHNFYYDQMKQYDAGTAYYYCTISTIWDPDVKNFYNSGISISTGP
jgi:hypothetical protein